MELPRDKYGRIEFPDDAWRDNEEGRKRLSKIIEEDDEEAATEWWREYTPSTDCTTCGGTILPPAVAGVERGTCTCQRPGRLTAKLFYKDEDHPGGWRCYGVEWEGIEIAVQPPTLARAVEVLNKLRADAAAIPTDMRDDIEAPRYLGDVE